MEKARRTLQSRSQLDKRYSDIRPIERFAPPVRGWIKAVRESLGMTTGQLARRLSISQPSVSELERSELKGTIALASLRRIAEALDCKLVYALVPNKPLETMVRDQARKVAHRRLAAVDHTMLLERQQVAPQEIDSRLDDVARDIKPRDLWDES
jgi:predicted DNA-binding mobile mystery protein A